MISSHYLSLGLSINNFESFIPKTLETSRIKVTVYGNVYHPSLPFHQSFHHCEHCEGLSLRFGRHQPLHNEEVRPDSRSLDA